MRTDKHIKLMDDDVDRVRQNADLDENIFCGLNDYIPFIIGWK